MQLGWDIVAARSCRQPDIPGFPEVTKAPQCYGFHGTLKPPFHLADGKGLAQLQASVASFAQTCAPMRCDSLALSPVRHFLALTPVGGSSGIARIATGCVAEFDARRAAPDEQELVHRRKAGLTARQDLLLTRGGYLLTKVDVSCAGRADAPCGGIYIAASIAWLWVVEGQIPTRWDQIEAGLCLLGMGIILIAPFLQK